MWDAVGLLFMFGTGVLHVGYFLSLQEGYRVGDFSVVYPLARGNGSLTRQRSRYRPLRRTSRSGRRGGHTPHRPRGVPAGMEP
jgi:hypothetical protein